MTLFDPRPTDVTDLSAQFYLTAEDVGLRRDLCSHKRLAELNEYVPVAVLDGVPAVEALDAATLARFQVVVLTDQRLAVQLAINEHTHPAGIAFIAASLHGLFASVFCDFGGSFTVADATGEPPLVGMISAISRDADSVVTCIEDTRHGLEDGDHVVFREVKGMAELNGAAPRPVKVLGPFTFSIGDTAALGDYQTGGVFEQVKPPKTLSFLPLKASLTKPEYVISDFAKIDRQVHIHAGFQALSVFESRFQRLPAPRDAADAEELVRLAAEVATSSCLDVALDGDLIRQMAYTAQGYLAPLAAFIGGLVAQEVLKACSGKFSPVFQHFYFDALECLPASAAKLTPSDCAPVGSRYDAQIAVFGRAFQEKIASLRGFIVGAGAIGCELLKVFALMGVGCGSGGQGYVQVTDMDTIEKSNLNRQFLFRPWDVSKPKSQTATDAIALINPDTKGRFVSKSDRVGPETENIFSEDFFEPLDFVANALDNVDARKYVDRRCVFFRKPLLESGTLGTKGNTQVVIPHLTESYSSSHDPPEKTIPFCTLHNFPNTIEHTIQWSMDQFHGVFRTDPENVNLYLTQPKEYIDSLLQPGQGQKDRLERVIRCLVSEKPLSLEQCISWARLRFEENFNSNIRQLLFNFPPDSVTSTGTPFWSGPKRAPTPLEFDDASAAHLDFIVAAANLRAENYGLKGSSDRAFFRAVLAKVIVPEFTPRSGVKIQVNEAEAAAPAVQTSAEEIEELVHALPEPSTMVGYRMRPIEFEKDDDTNFHIDYVAATANLRAMNYGITPAERHTIKQIAGKIIPAIATTTAVVAGLVSLELYKLLDVCGEGAGVGAEGTGEGIDKKAKWDVSKFKNGFINLALPFCAFSEPILAQKSRYYETEWTLWDRFEVEGDLTLAELIELFQKQHKILITMLSHGTSMLYGFIRSKEVIEERMRTKMSKLVEAVSKKALPPHTKSLVLEILGEDVDGEDVEVPYVLVKLC